MYLHNELSDLREMLNEAQNPTTVMVECQRFRFLKIRNGGRICTDTLQKQTLHSVVIKDGLLSSYRSGRCIHLYARNAALKPKSDTSTKQQQPSLIIISTFHSRRMMRSVCHDVLSLLMIVAFLFVYFAPLYFC